MSIALEQRPDGIDFRMLNRLILASVPGLVIGLWVVGLHVARLSNPSDSLSGVSAIVLPVLEGASWFLPRCVIAGLVSLAWAAAFSRLRGRPLDPGWLVTAWLFVLLLPAATPLPLIVIGLSFGLVFGCHVFGGTGRYIVNPALLAVVFLQVSYPGAMAGNWVPGSEQPSTWTVAAMGGMDALTTAGIRWVDVALGLEAGAVGATSTLACTVGMGFLLVTGLASKRLVAGALLGLLAVAVCYGSMPWMWQPVLGNFTFALAFLGADPTTLPESRIGRWATGFLFGALVIVLRMQNPEHPEGTLFALLLASLTVPLIDYMAKNLRPVTKSVHDGG